MVLWKAGASVMCVENRQSGSEERQAWMEGRVVASEFQTRITPCCPWAPQSHL